VSGLVFAIVVVVFAVAGALLVRRTQRGAVVDRLPLEQGEQVLFAEERANVFHRFRRTARFGRSGTETRRVRIVLTDRRIIVATGGPEGRHKFVIQMILDYSSPAPAVAESGYAAYLGKFRLENGYPTYPFTREDLSLVESRGRTAVRIVVPFPERGPRWGDPPEVVLYTSRPEEYQERFDERPTR
jgi:hypothetical protein